MAGAEIGWTACQQIPDECNNLQLNPSDPSTATWLLKCSGWDENCQTNVVSALSSCVKEIRSISSASSFSGLFASTGGQVSSTCCDSLYPLLSAGCLCQDQAVKPISSVFDYQNTTEFIEAANGLLSSFGCNALNGGSEWSSFICD